MTKVSRRSFVAPLSFFIGNYSIKQKELRRDADFIIPLERPDNVLFCCYGIGLESISDGAAVNGNDASSLGNL